MSDNMLSLYKEGANKIEPETELTRWRLSTVEGRQKWYYVPENEECAREQNALEAYTLGLNTSKFFPELPKASTAQEAVLKAIKFFSGVQAEDGHWPAECSGVLTLAPGLLIACYVAKVSLPEEVKKEIHRYIRSRQLPEGGWGLHLREQQPTIFGTALNYIAMRILGYGPDHPDIVRARISLHKKGGALVTCIHLGKVWLAIVNVYSWEGMNAPFPELWLLPTWVPGHPSTYWCHARHILLAMTYCQLNRLSAEEDELIRSLRQELYVEDYSSIDWPAQKNYIYEADLQTPHTLVLDVFFALFNLYDRYHLTSLRKKATAELYEQIKADDIFSNSTNSSPAGIQNNPEYNTCLKKAHSFFKCSQIVDNPPNYQRYYRQMNKGGFPFSNRDNNWIVSDGTAEAIRALMLLEEQCPFIEDHIAPQRIFDAVNVILNMRNSDGGFSSYETRRGSWLLEAVNCAETYGKKKLSGVICKIQIGDPDWNVAWIQAQEMTSYNYLHMLALKMFQKLYDTLHKALQYCRNTQKAGGSWLGRWGVCFIYGTWFALEAFACLGYTYHNGLACNEVTKACAWLVSKQMKDGGWGEEFESYKLSKYIQHTISQIHQTAWALLGLMAAKYPDVHVLERGIQVLIDKQQAIGDWPQGDIAIGFYKAGTLHYSAYRNIFPIYALARFTHLYPDNPLASQHLKNGPINNFKEGQTKKH
ncbi:PREDICTED: LOW QUALITY PROTEIN: lanosterol synthase [Thamnophis sirtalis]|uniref:LOW QUALITY PROTEIN: lanosterol synthase n=1 Tax=Thamnophis sirtalis TaxID=35019 RepID=A0A6I9YAF3_9SAUR|nr:PREDICTED: LOW QUALITY PROTEIN: lanosterol synthase [Thamnophis sirtalis]